mmetsp:Transcript_50304/g.118147  ORF Transcript_50304/g.118147 Transcript_50304/m.118147 type:complete len:253 (-) Transcript_50304:1336-2094(-)
MACRMRPLAERGNSVRRAEDEGLARGGESQPEQHEGRGCGNNGAMQGSGCSSCGRAGSALEGVRAAASRAPGMQAEWCPPTGRGARARLAPCKGPGPGSRGGSDAPGSKAGCRPRRVHDAALHGQGPRRHSLATESRLGACKCPALERSGGAPGQSERSSLGREATSARRQWFCRFRSEGSASRKSIRSGAAALRGQSWHERARAHPSRGSSCRGQSNCAGDLQRGSSQGDGHRRLEARSGPLAGGATKEYC